MVRLRVDDTTIYHRHMPDGFMYELRQSPRFYCDWEARRQEGDEWTRKQEAGWAVIAAYEATGEHAPSEFMIAAHEWGQECLAADKAERKARAGR